METLNQGILNRDSSVPTFRYTGKIKGAIIIDNKYTIITSL
jgi:hypothetical protein